MRRFHVLAAAALLVFHSPLEAADFAPWSSFELQQHCLEYTDASQSADSLLCAAYLRGFIEGSSKVQFLTDEVKSGRRESFDERAFRTRLGVRRDAKSLYCVDRSLSLSQFVAEMLAQLKERPPEEGPSASAVIYATLQRFHRCSA